MRPDRLRDQLEALPVDLLDGLRRANRHVPAKRLCEWCDEEATGPVFRTRRGTMLHVCRDDSHIAAARRLMRESPAP